MFGMFRRSVVIGSSAVITASYSANKFKSSITDTQEGNQSLNATSKFISMFSKLQQFKLSEIGNGGDVDDTLMYLFQSKIFESPYHSLYLCYPQTTTAVGLTNHGYGKNGRAHV
eukprot:363310_1